MKNTTHDIAQWTRNIITWALLGIAAAQFTDLRDTVKEMHKMVIRHDEQLKTQDKEITRLRDIPQLSERKGPWNYGLQDR